MHANRIILHRFIHTDGIIIEAIMNCEYTCDDIYYCSCCGEFYNRYTHLRVEVPYEEMPADFALKVMEDRQKLSHKAQARRKARIDRKNKGFR